MARVNAGLAQSVTARASGISRSALGRIERGQRASVGLVELSTVLAVVGLRLGASTYPDGVAHRDRGHQLVGQATRRFLPATAPWRTEVPFPNAGDHRSWDHMAILEGQRVAFECETRPRDGQELQRRMSQKRRDGSVDRLILVLMDTRANRRFLVDHATELAADFPTPAREVLRALAEGRPPSGDGVILVHPLRHSADRGGDWAT